MLSVRGKMVVFVTVAKRDITVACFIFNIKIIASDHQVQASLYSHAVWILYNIFKGESVSDIVLMMLPHAPYTNVMLIFM